MIQHSSPISGVDAFGDRFVATAGYDNRVILWDAARQSAVSRGYHDHLANQCRFSPCGNYLVSASSDYTARVWSVPRMSLVSVLASHDDDVEMAAFDSTGERVATACRDGSVRVFTVEGSLLFRLQGHSADALSVEWTSPAQLVSSSDDGTVRRWDAVNGRLLETFDFESVETDTFAVLPGTGELCVGNDRGEITVLANGSRRTTRVHASGIKRVVAGPNDVLLTTSYDRTAKLWRLRENTLELCQTIDLPPEVWPRSAAYANPGRVVFGTFGTTYATYDLAEQNWDLSRVEPTAGINGICFDDGVYSVGDAGVVARNDIAVGEVGSLCNFVIRAGGRTLTGGQTGRLFDAHTGEILHEHRSPLNCAVTFAAGGGRRLVVGTYTGEALVFDYSDQRLTHVDTVRLHENAVKGVAVNGIHLFSVCATGAAAFHRLPDLDPAKHFPHAHDKIANGAAALPDGRFVSVGRDLMLRVWSTDMSSAIKTPHEHSIKCVASSSTSELVATGGYDGTVGLYDWRREDWVGFERPTTSGISCIVGAPRPGVFLASSYDGHVYEVAST